MNHEAMLFNIRRLSRDIHTEHLKIQGDMPGKRSFRYSALQLKIENWEHFFIRATKTLKSRSHFNDMIYRQQRFSQNAYSAGQSHSSKQQNVRTLSSALRELERNLRDLVQTLAKGKGDAANSLDAIGRVLDNWMTAAQHSEEGLTGSIPIDVQLKVTQAHTQITAGQTNVPPPPPVIDIFTLLLAYFALVKAIAKRTKDEK